MGLLIVIVIGCEVNPLVRSILISKTLDLRSGMQCPEASFVFASDRSLKVCYYRSLANTKLASG